MVDTIYISYTADDYDEEEMDGRGPHITESGLGTDSKFYWRQFVLTQFSLPFSGLNYLAQICLNPISCHFQV